MHVCVCVRTVVLLVYITHRTCTRTNTHTHTQTLSCYLYIWSQYPLTFKPISFPHPVTLSTLTILCLKCLLNLTTLFLLHESARISDSDGHSRLSYSLASVSAVTTLSALQRVTFISQKMPFSYSKPVKSTLLPFWKSLLSWPMSTDIAIDRLFPSLSFLNAISEIETDRQTDIQPLSFSAVLCILMRHPFQQSRNNTEDHCIKISKRTKTIW